MRCAIAVIAVAGCASGSSPLAQGQDAAVVDAGEHDAPPSVVDARPDAQVPDAYVPDAYVPDAYVPDAYVPDAYVPDAYVPDAYVPDAYVPDAPPDACVPVTAELLANPAFDLSPQGTGWSEAPIDVAYPLVTGDDGIVEHSAPYKAWLGGIVSDLGTVTDALWQDVVVPAGTTQLVLTGYYAVVTLETTTSSVFDTASLRVIPETGGSISVLGLTNLTTTATWTPFQHTFTQDLAGQTVRVRMTSSNDLSGETSFYFDTLSLRATYCP